MMEPERSAPAPGAARDAHIVSLGEEERAETLARAGMRVVRYRGRPWAETRPGFYEPVHVLARLAADEVGRPAALCWGFRATLRDDAAGAANGAVPLHVLAGFADFDETRLSPQRRSRLRRSRREAAIVPLPDPRLLREQGHALYVSQLARTRHRRIPTAAEYLASLERVLVAGRPLVLVAMVGDRLAGYLHGTAVDGVAYVGDVVVGTAFLPLQVGTGLKVEFLLACRRSPGVHAVVDGLHAREDPGLDEFKEGLGFEVVRVPSRVALPAPLRAYLRWRRPHVHYRLTGS
jgi:hypothetical protein